VFASISIQQVGKVSQSLLSSEMNHFTRHEAETTKPQKRSDAIAVIMVIIDTQIWFSDS